MHIEDGGFWQVHKVVVPRTRPHTGKEVGRVKEEIVFREK